MASNRQNRGSKIKRFSKDLFLTNRFFIAIGILVLGLFVSFVFSFLFIVIQILIGVFVVLIIADCVLLFRPLKGFSGSRIVPSKLSNGDENKISIRIENHYPFKVNAEIIEEAPFQLQERDLTFSYNLDVDEELTVNYNLRPTSRGEYFFGAVNVFVTGIFSLVKRRYIFPEARNVAVYPSFLEMNKFELLAASNRLTEYGIKQIRRIGNATEFEHIKQYVHGDDPRTINYKATARTNELMVNTYVEERSQPVYCIVDKGRTMKMPFRGMTLLDYAINSSLIIANTALSKGDKAGLITFSNNIDDVLPANNKAMQRNLILEKLYRQKTNYLEANYARLYLKIRQVVRHRSLIVLYTNFETLNGLQRQLKYLRLIAKNHLLIVAFFVNSEVEELLNDEPEDLESIFVKGAAESFSNDKLLIAKELNRYGIHTILSKPESLTIDSVNKYLELKARGLI